jgi:hypothetical protein
MVEENYGREMIKAAQSTMETFDKAHPKLG